MAASPVRASLTRAEMAEIRERCENEIREATRLHADREVAIADDIEHLAAGVHTRVDSWISQNLEFVSKHISCIAPMKMDIASRAVVSSLVRRQRELRRDYGRLKPPQRVRPGEAPFNTQSIAYAARSLLPMVARVEYLKRDVLSVTGRLYRL